MVNCFSNPIICFSKGIKSLIFLIMILLLSISPLKALDDDHSDSSTDATVITVDTSVTGDIEVGGDYDFFSFTATEGEAYSFAVTLNTLDDSELYLYDTDGTTLITGNDDYDENSAASKIVWRCPATGTYYLAISGDWAASAGTYSILATGLGVDDYANDSHSATPAVLDISLSGNIDYSEDVDLFAFTATAGEAYSFVVTPGTLYDARLRLLDTDGVTELATNSDVVVLDGPLPGDTTAGGGQGGGTGSTGTVPGVDNPGPDTIYPPYEPTITWTCPVDGAYYIQISSWYSSGALGTYTLLATGLGADDHGSTYSTASPVTVDTPVTGNIDYGNDVDFFSIDAISGTLYSFEVMLGSLEDSVVIIYDSDGTTQVAYNDDTTSGFGSTAIWTCTADGTYYIAVFSYWMDATGSYTLLASTITDDDHGNIPSTASPVAVETTTDGDIGYDGDVDYFSFQADQGTSYKIEVTLGTLYDTDLFFYDTNGTSLIDYAYYPPSITWTCPTSGTYYVAVAGWFSTGTYSLSVTTTIIVDDHGNDYTTATALTVETSASGELEIGNDVDYFSFLAVAGTTYSISTTLITLPDSYLTLYDTDGTSVILFNDDNGVDFASNIFWTCDLSGTYYLSVSGYFSSDIGTYSILVSTSQTADDHGNDYTTATPVEVGVPVGGNIETFLESDIDYFSFLAVGGWTYTIETTLGTLDDSVLYLYDIDGVTELAYNDDVDDNSYASSISWTCPSDGTYYVAVAGLDWFYFVSSGTYTLSINCNGDCLTDDHGNEPELATDIVAGAAIAGTIDEPDDVDWFAFPATEGSTYDIEVILITLGDSFLTLYGIDASTEIISDDNSGVGNGSLVSWTCNSSGTYYIKVIPSSDAIGDYSLSVTEVASDGYGDGNGGDNGDGNGDGDSAVSGGGDDSSSFCFIATASYGGEQPPIINKVIDSIKKNVIY